MKIRSRSSRSDRSEVSRTTSAWARTGSRSRRSFGDRARDAALVVERVAVARLREAADQDLVAGLEKEHLRPDPMPLERAAHGGEGVGRVTGPDVQHDRDLGEPLGIARHEGRQVRQHLARQVVDAGVAEVLEQLRRGGLAGPGEPAQDHDVLLRGGVNRM